MITISFSHLCSLTLALEQLCIYVSEKQDGWECKRSHKNSKKAGKEKKNYSYCTYETPCQGLFTRQPLFISLYDVVVIQCERIVLALRVSFFFFSSSPNLTFKVNLFALVCSVCYPHKNRSEDLRLNTVGARMVTPVYIQP